VTPTPTPTPMPTPRRVVSGPLLLFSLELLELLELSLLSTVLPSVSTASLSLVTGAVDEEVVGVASVVSDVEVAFCEALVGADDDAGRLEVSSAVGFGSADSALEVVSLGVALVGLAVVVALEVSSSAEASWRTQNWPV
jgi:hypothetical protein